MENLLRQYASLSTRKPWTLLALFGVITALSVVLGQNITVDTGLESLLPSDAPSVLAIDEARARRGGQDLFVIAIESPDPLATVQFVDALAESFADWEEVEYFDYERSQSFFREHALLYLTMEDLGNIEDNLRRMIRRRLGQNHPLFTDLEAPADPAEDTWDWHDWTMWISPFTLKELAIEEDAIGTLFPFLDNSAETAEEGADGTPAPVTPPTAEELRNEQIRQARWDLPEQYQDYRIAPHGRVAVFAAKLSGSSTDIDYARAAYERAEAVIAELDPASYNPEMKVQVAGAYRSFLEVRAVVGDAVRATQIAVVIILFLLIGFFRNLRSVYIVLTPLLVGIAWTLGLVDVVYGQLNALTLFVFSMLVGMGIDFSIHVYRRLLDERAAGADWETASFYAISRTGRALVTATATTTVSLLMLNFASFDGFREFGIACAMGVVLCLVSAILIIPPLVAASERVKPSKPPVPGLTPSEGPPWLLTACRVGAVIVLLVGALGVLRSNQVAFEYDFGNLSTPADPNRVRYGAALGPASSSAPAVMLGADEAQMREVHALLSQRFRDGDPLIRGFATIVTLLPSAEQQAERMDQIDEIYSVLDRRAVQRIDGEEGEVIAELTRLTEVETFGADDLPDWSMVQFRERDGSFGSLGMLHGSYNKSDALEVREFQDAYGSIEVESGTVRVSSNGFILADVVRYVQADGRHLAAWVTLGLFLMLLIDLRDLKAVAVCMSTIGLAVALTLLGMVVFDIKLGLYNIVVLPTVLGVGIDGAIHLYHRYLEDGPTKTGAVMRSTGTAVLASSLTTAAGFVGLLMISHNGVRTIGALAVVGILASMTSALVVVPALVGRKPSSAA